MVHFQSAFYLSSILNHGFQNTHSWFFSFPTGFFFSNSFIWSFISFWPSNVWIHQSWVIEHFLCNLVQIHAMYLLVASVCISSPVSPLWLQTQISNYLLDIFKSMSENQLILDIIKIELLLLLSSISIQDSISHYLSFL